MILSDKQIKMDWWNKALYLTELRESHLEANAMIRDLDSKMERARKAEALLRDIVEGIQDYFVEEYGHPHVWRENATLPF